MINGLDAFLSERGLLRTCPLSALKDTRIGIDLDVYLRSVLSNPATADPFAAALGGMPHALVSHVESDVVNLVKQKQIKPVFVLSGLAPAIPKSSKPAFSQEEHKARLRAQAWEAYEEGDVPMMQELLLSSRSIEVNDVVRAVLRMFRHRAVEFLVAPYLANAQLVSLERHPHGYIHSLYGSTSLFLFPRVDRVILSIDVAAGSFTYASKQAVMSELGVRSEDEFLDLSLLAGWDHGPTFPPLVDGTLAPMPAPSTSKEAANSQQSHRPVNLRQILDLIRQHRGTAMGVIHAFSEHAGVRAQGFIDLFAKSKAIIKTSMVVRPEDGGVVPMNLALNDASVPNGNAGNAVNGNGSAEVPSDLHDVFSYRLPDEVFLHLSRGMITPHVYTWLTSGYLTVPAPLDNGETIEYRRFVSDILTESPTSPHCLALAVAASSLHSFWQSRKVLASYWWQPQAERPIPFDSKSTQQLVSRAHQWNVPGTFIDEVLRSTGSNTIDIALCLSATKTSELGQRTITPKEAGKQPLVKKSEIGANVVWRFLELRDFLSSDHLHKPYARALHLALRDAKINDKTQEPLYLALELIREGALTANFYTSPGPDAGPQTFSGGPSYGEKEDEKRWLLLIMRSMSLLPMQYRGTAWTAPVSREMLVFNSFSRALGRSLRHLVETIASSMMLQSEAVRGGVDYLNVAFSLPFQTDADTGLGVVIKCYIEAFIAFHGQPPTEEEHVSGQTKDSKEGVLEMLDGTFGNVRDVRGEIKRGFRYWESLMVAVRLLVERDSIGQAAAKDFEDADRWLKPFRL